MNACISVEYLRECFDADFEAGTLTWRRRPTGHFATELAAQLWNGRFAGTPAGGPHKEGYMSITLTRNGHRKVLLAHRVLWCMRMGEWPRVTIDHRDMNRTNNRWDNLREASYSDQNANRRSGRNGLKGVTYDKATGRYIAVIERDGKRNWLGRFKTELEAHQAYAEAAERLHGQFARLS